MLSIGLQPSKLIRKSTSLQRGSTYPGIHCTSPPPRSLCWQVVLACDDVDDVDNSGGDVDEYDFDDDGDDVLACAPSSIVQSTAHECQGFQSPSSPDKESSFGWLGGLKS